MNFAELLDLLTEKYTFLPEWETGENSFTVSVNEIDVFGYGDTHDEAAEVLARAFMEYTELYFRELAFYRSSMVNRSSHYPYLRRIARCNNNVVKVKKLLGV